MLNIFYIVAILYLTRNHLIYRQFCLTLFFMVIAVLLDKLVMTDLKKSEMLYLGIYMFSFYFYVVKGDSIVLSSMGFSFVIIYFSFALLLNIEDTMTIFTNFTICMLQGYITFLLEKIRHARMKSKGREKEKWNYIFDKIFPGITVLIKKKKLKHTTSDLNTKSEMAERQVMEIQFINERGKEKYSMETIEDFLDFCKQIKIINSNKTEEFPENLNLQDMLLGENFDENEENFLSNIGVHQDNEEKLKIYISNYIWDGEYFLFIHIDDQNFENKIQILKEVDVKKNELLASVTHDLRSPLNGIIAFIANAKDCEDITLRNQFLEYARINGALLLSLINDILDYSSFINNKFRLHIEKINLSNFLDEISSLMSIQADFKSIDFKIINPFSAELNITTDARRLKQILINLISNSLKFTLKGSIKVKLSIKSDPQILKFSVSDTGVGIAADRISKLCLPYATYNKGNLNNEGIGLGLSICKKFVSLLGPNDELIIRSQEGKGTKIKFLIFKNLKFESIKSKTFKINGSVTQREKINLSSNKERGHQRKSEKTEHENTLNLDIPRTLETLQKTISIPMLRLSDINSRIPSMASNKSLGRAKNKRMNNYSMIETNGRQKQQKHPSFQDDYQLIRKNNKNMKDSIHSKHSMDMSLYSQTRKANPIPVIERKSKLPIITAKEKDSFSVSGNNTIFTIDKKTVKSSALVESFDDYPRELNILIVDDNPFNCLVLSNYLKRQSLYAVYFECVSNGLECVEKFKDRNNINSEKKSYQIIILDCLMPLKNGYEATKDIKNLIATGFIHKIL